MKRSENGTSAGPAKPIPDYGRAVAYGLAAAVAGACLWVAFQLYVGFYTILLAVAAGWLCGTAVKRGVGAVTRAGIGLSFYFTALTVFLGEYAYFGWHYVTIAGRFSPGGALALLGEYYAGHPLRLVIMLVFTLTGMVIALIYSR